MVELVRHRQTKEAATDRFHPTATAPHLDSTKSEEADQQRARLVWRVKLTCCGPSQFGCS